MAQSTRKLTIRAATQGNLYETLGFADHARVHFGDLAAAMLDLSASAGMSPPISDTAVSLPGLALRPFISHYAGFRMSGLPPGVHFGLPSTAVDLIISLAGPIDVVQMPNAKQPPSAFTALVNGLQDAPAILRLGRDVFGLHIFIKPQGVRFWVLRAPTYHRSS